MRATAIRVDETYNCTQQRLWEVLTDPDELSAWLGGRCVIEPRVGGSIRLQLDADGLSASGAVRSFEPPRPDRSVAFIEHSFVDDARPEVTSVCRWGLVDHGETCDLHFTHDGFDERSRDALTGAWSRLGATGSSDGETVATTVDEATELLRAARTVLLVSFVGPEVPTTLVSAGFAVVAKTGPDPDDWARCDVADGELVTTPIARPAAADLVHLDWDAFDEYLEVAVQLGARTIWYHSGRTRPPEPHDTRGCWVPAPQSVEQRRGAELAGVSYVDEHYIAEVARRIS